MRKAYPSETPGEALIPTCTALIRPKNDSTIQMPDVTAAAYILRSITNTAMEPSNTPANTAPDPNSVSPW